MPQKVLVAMSGGVDSSVAALLLKEQGYDIIGAHMKLWDYVDVGGDLHQDGRCCTIDSITDCRMVCDRIGAPFYVLNMSAKFRDTVIDNFVSEYRAGRTPNPCVMCNSDIKWSAFLHKARELGCDYLATGHYAFVEQGRGGRWQIRKGVDSTRDQSYVLWGISQEALAMTLMPLGGLHKREVRAIAEAHGLRTAKKPESREICFVADNDYRRFLREWEEKHNLGRTPGEIVHENGEILGTHEGTTDFTIGQRRGIGLPHPLPTPLYVQRIDATSHRVIVGDNSSLYRDELIAEHVNWVGLPPPNREEGTKAPGRPQLAVGSGWPTIHRGEEHSKDGSSPPLAVGSGWPTIYGGGEVTKAPGRPQLAVGSELEKENSCTPPNGRVHPPRSVNSPSNKSPHPRDCEDTGESPGDEAISIDPNIHAAPSFPALVKIRYLHTPGPARITCLTDGRLHIKFTDKQRAITPGQSVVFYDGDILLGGGIIAQL